MTVYDEDTMAGCEPSERADVANPRFSTATYEWRQCIRVREQYRARTARLLNCARQSYKSCFVALKYHQMYTSCIHELLY